MQRPDPTPALLARAEEGLFAAAFTLRRIPLSARTRHLHLRALSLKRDVRRACIDGASAAEAGRLVAEVNALRDEVRRLQLREPCSVATGGR